MLVKASARLLYLSIPPRKMRLVADMVKGMPVEDALNVLNFTPKIAAHHLAKTVKSAAANALSIEGTDALKPEDLYIKDIAVDQAPTAKRIRFQSMGRIFRIRKRFCHLTVKLEAEMAADEIKAAPKAKAKVEEKAPAKKATAKKTAKKPAAKKTTGKKEVTDKKPAKKATAAKTKKTVASKKADPKSKSADK